MATLSLTTKNSGTTTDINKSNKFDYMLQENGGRILLEGIGAIVLEQSTTYPPSLSLTTKNSGSLSLSTKH